MNEFEKLGLSKELIEVIRDLDFKTPSEIQKRTIPLILEGKDVIGNAATGSGKTLAFASGIIDKVDPNKGIQALVLTPTRELAVQIAKVITTFSKNTPFKIQEIYGGVNMQRQIDGAKNAEIIIGTPGRILDHLTRRTLDFSKLKILVLDEADRLVDMGFLPDVDKIISQCNKDRQTLLFSATTSQDVDRIAGKYLVDPEEVIVEKNVDPSKLKQRLYDVPTNLKFSLLVDLLKKEKSGISMIFCNTRRNVDLVVKNLRKFKIESHSIHGQMDQKKRNKVIEEFHTEKAYILVCTDVAARGIDIKNVTHIYNYDSPKTLEEYIHRIGRTARAGEEGLAINLVSQKDYGPFRKILHKGSMNIEQKDLPKFRKLNPDFRSDNFEERNNRGGGYSRGGSRGRSYSRRDSHSAKPRNSSGSRSGSYSRGGSSYKSNDRNKPRRPSGAYSRGRSEERSGSRDRSSSGSKGGGYSRGGSRRSGDRNKPRVPSKGRGYSKSGSEGKSYSNDRSSSGSKGGGYSRRGSSYKSDDRNKPRSHNSQSHDRKRDNHRKRHPR